MASHHTKKAWVSIDISKVDVLDLVTSGVSGLKLKWDFPTHRGTIKSAHGLSMCPDENQNKDECFFVLPNVCGEWTRPTHVCFFKTKLWFSSWHMKRRSVLTPDVSHSIHFSKEPRMRQTIRIHPHSSLIKLLYALRCVREKALLASKRPIAFHLQRSSVEKIPFNAYRNIHWKLRIIYYFHCVRYLVHFNVYAQAGWRMPN